MLINICSATEVWDHQPACENELRIWPDWYPAITDIENSSNACLVSINDILSTYEKFQLLVKLPKQRQSFRLFDIFPGILFTLKEYTEFAVLHQTTTSQISESCSSKIREMWAINSTDNKSIFRINLILDIYALQIQSKWTLNAVPTVKIHKQWCT